MTDGWTNGKIVLLSHTLTTRGSQVASLVSVVKEKVARRTDGRKNNVALARPYMYQVGESYSQYRHVPQDHYYLAVRICRLQTVRIRKRI